MRAGASTPQLRIASEFGQMRAGAIHREEKIKKEEIKEVEKVNDVEIKEAESATHELKDTDLNSMTQPQLWSLASKRGYKGSRDKQTLIEFLQTTS